MKVQSMLSCLLLPIFIVACSSASMKLTKQDVTSSTRLIFGKIVDLNPESKPSELQVTYVLQNSDKALGVSFGNKFPYLEPKSDFFWISVPQDTKYFGVTSIRFGINGMEGTAIIRDDKTHKALMGTELKPGNEPVYIGEIVIRSGTRKYGAIRLPAEGFDLKELNIKATPKMAKDILDRNGIDSSKIIINTPKINNI